MSVSPILKKIWHWTWVSLLTIGALVGLVLLHMVTSTEPIQPKPTPIPDGAQVISYTQDSKAGDRVVLLHGNSLKVIDLDGRPVKTVHFVRIPEGKSPTK